MKILLPPGWPRPRGYSNGVAVKGSMVFVAGMIGWDAQGKFHTSDMAGQVRQALQNIVEVLKEGGARPEHIVRMTWYVKNKKEYVAAYPEIGVAFRELIGSFNAVMTAIRPPVPPRCRPPAWPAHPVVHNAGSPVRRGPPEIW